MLQKRFIQNEWNCKNLKLKEDGCMHTGARCCLMNRWQWLLWGSDDFKILYFQMSRHSSHISSTSIWLELDSSLLLKHFVTLRVLLLLVVPLRIIIKYYYSIYSVALCVISMSMHIYTKGGKRMRASIRKCCDFIQMCTTVKYLGVEVMMDTFCYSTKVKVLI